MQPPRRCDGGTADRRQRSDPTVDFLSCHCVRIRGHVDDVIVSLEFEADDGQFGTITEPVGGIDGERTIDAAAEFGLDPAVTVLTSVEVFETVDVATPGLGDERYDHPTLETCRAATVGHLEGVDTTPALEAAANTLEEGKR